VLYGALLLFVYALGHSALVLIAGTSVGAAKSLLESKGLRTAHGVLQKAAGILIIGLGLYFLFGT
jgi:cytochrome c-type biogenesis protein